MNDKFKITELHMKSSPCYTSPQRISPRGAVLHSTATPGATHTNFYSLWNQPDPDAGVHFIIDGTGIYQLLPEDRRSWHAGPPANDLYLSCEICEPGTFAYNGQWESMGNYNPSLLENKAYFQDVYAKAVWLFARLCQKYGWKPDKSHVLCHYEVYQRGEGTCHIDVTHWFPKHGKTMDLFRDDVQRMMKNGTFDSGSEAAPVRTGTQPTEFAGLNESQTAAKILELVKGDYQKTGILPSITAAQMILESGYVTSELALNACNCFGMKTSLSGNSWPGSTWDGTSVYTKITEEEYTPGTITKVTADFRKYSCLEQSIADHSAYLSGAQNNKEPRYQGLTSAKKYRDAAVILKNGGYATDCAYVDKLCSLIERWHLDQYDCVQAPSYKKSQYVTCSSYYLRSTDPISKAIIKPLSGTITAIRSNDPNPYCIDGKYWVNNGDIRDSNSSKTFSPYQIKITAPDVHMRAGAGTDYPSNGFTGIGVFGITAEVQDTQGRIWGKLKSGAGYVALWLDCVNKI